MCAACAVVPALLAFEQRGRVCVCVCGPGCVRIRALRTCWGPTWMRAPVCVRIAATSATRCSRSGVSTGTAAVGGLSSATIRRLLSSSTAPARSQAPAAPVFDVGITLCVRACVRACVHTAACVVGAIWMQCCRTWRRCTTRARACSLHAKHLYPPQPTATHTRTRAHTHTHTHTHTHAQKHSHMLAHAHARTHTVPHGLPTIAGRLDPFRLLLTARWMSLQRPGAAPTAPLSIRLRIGRSRCRRLHRRHQPSASSDGTARHRSLRDCAAAVVASARGGGAVAGRDGRRIRSIPPRRLPTCVSGQAMAPAHDRTASRSRALQRRRSPRGYGQGSRACPQARLCGT